MSTGWRSYSFRQIFKTPIPRTDCKDNNDYVGVGCLAVVTFQSKFDLITPIVRQILFPSGVTLTAQTILPVEFTCPNPTITASSGCPKQP